MVECESVSCVTCVAIPRVLIDTWWNVNKIKAKVFEEGKASFNRYMVECEYTSKSRR